MAWTRKHYLCASLPPRLSVLKKVSLSQVFSGEAGLRSWFMFSDVPGGFLQFPQHRFLEGSQTGTRGTWPFPACNGDNIAAAAEEARACCIPGASFVVKNDQYVPNSSH